jgi:hypothetical protein
MSAEHVAEALALANLIQFVFWAFVANKLVNKVMSRDFAEYSLIKKGPKKKDEVKDDLAARDEELEVLNEVNAMFGVN